MIIYKTNISYFNSKHTNPTIKGKHDYLLFRQDFNGQEFVYFYKHEIKEILKMIDVGEILIHMNYSILYCRSKDCFDFFKQDVGCYKLIEEKLKKKTFK